ncbi:MAG: 16S rRNA (cytidine(1402)-2'-O)-methyltransferase [Ruminococcaceae bacterium]|nr:16S rRNA (cytidine(1402)-2'-O)-methyltransferase [Oscillospiraceae bacterium]
MAGKLYLVGTPIGNLGDLSPRAVKTLEEADFIAAEDTRVTVKLLNHLGLKKTMLSYYEHNKKARGGEIIERLLSGENCALVTDAGMPAISDPGEDMVRLAYENGIAVESVPGPSAVVTALAISGMPSGRFTFEGFLTVNKPGRRAHLAEIKEEKRTMIFYEAPHKLLSTLSDMLDILGDREIAIVRELTKIHEEVIHTTFKKAMEFYTENSPRGEFVLIVSGFKEEKRLYTLEEAVEIAKEFYENGEPASLAAKKAAEITNIKKGDIYRGMNK